MMPWQIESSSIAPVSIDMTNHTTPKPFKASISFENQPCMKGRCTLDNRCFTNVATGMQITVGRRST